MAHLSNLHRKFAASAFVAALAVSAVAPASATGYSDVSERYKEAVNYLEVEEITEGLTATSFGTGNSIKRADAAILLAKALELDTEKAPESKFTDVPSRAKKYVDALKAKGIINGKTTETFASEQLITRGEAALMLEKAYELEAGKTSNTFKDVSSKYENAVNSLLGNKVTSGKTNTFFGVEQSLTRGEFAIFLHKLSTIHTPNIELSVATETELKSALSNDKVSKVVLTKNIVANALPTIERNVEIDLNGKTLTGKLKYKNYTVTNEFQLLSSVTGGVLQGDLSMDVPKSDFIVGENVRVTGNTTIINVKENTFYNNGSLQSVNIQDNDGVSFTNKGNVIGMIALNTTGNVKLSGKLDSVEVNQAAKITIEDSSTIKNLNVKVSDVVLNAPTGAIETTEVAPGIVIKDNAGNQVITKPTIPPVPTKPTPAPVDVEKLISQYEELQKAYIKADLINEERYWKYYSLAEKRKELYLKLKDSNLSNIEIQRLKDIDNALDSYFVDSFEMIVSIYAEHVDLRHSDGTGVKIAWSSSNPEVIGLDGKVTRPAKGGAAIDVTLTAEITKNDQSKVVEYIVTVDPEYNVYTSATSVATEEWEEYSKINGYFTSRLDVYFDLEEISKDYPNAYKAKVIINENMPKELVKTVENISIESEIKFENPIDDSLPTTATSVNVRIELMSDDGTVVTTFTNQVVVQNLMAIILEKFEEEKNSLNSETIYKYITKTNEYTTEEITEILSNFNKLSAELMTLEKLQELAVEIKQ